MSGKYVCRASNTAGSDSCHINLEVSTRKYRSQASPVLICAGPGLPAVNWSDIFLHFSAANNAWLIAGATVGSVVGLVALALFLIFVLRRSRDTEDEIANDIKWASSFAFSQHICFSLTQGW